MRNFQKDFIYRRWWHKTKFKYFQQSSHEARNNIQLEACKPINVIIDFKSTKQILLRSFRLCFQFVNGFDILAFQKKKGLLLVSCATLKAILLEETYLVSLQWIFNSKIKRSIKLRLLCNRNWGDEELMATRDCAGDSIRK